MGNLHKGPDQPVTARGFELRNVVMVGSYAVQPMWADGHNTGLYPFDYLKEVADAGQDEGSSAGSTENAS